MTGMPKEHVVQVRAELGNAVVVRPGDKLVYATPGPLTHQQADTIKARFAELLPGVEVVIADQCSGLAVYRDEPTGVIQLSQPLSAGEVQSLRERGVIGEDGKTTGDRLAEYFERNA